jgi:metal-responsive CopG/Arc/MetJ family transcriptional regulator
MTTTNKKIVTIYLTAENLKALDDLLADNPLVSRSSVINLALKLGWDAALEKAKLNKKEA